MGQAFFVTATGTDLGKTYISALLCKDLVNTGKKVAYYKAALSGAQSLSDSDASYVANYANLNMIDNVKVSYLFKEPLSPHLASRNVGVTIDKDVIKKDFSYIKDGHDITLVEGSGGIVCPLCFEKDNTFMLYDMVKMLDLKSLVIADAGLGTINALATTIDFMSHRDLEILGIILNNYDKDNLMHQDNLKVIESFTGIKVVATVATNGTLNYIDKDLLKIL